MEEEICSEEVSCYTGSLAPFKDDLIFPEDANFAALTGLLDRNEVNMDTVKQPNRGFHCHLTLFCLISYQANPKGLYDQCFEA